MDFLNPALSVACDLLCLWIGYIRGTYGYRGC